MIGPLKDSSPPQNKLLSYLLGYPWEFPQYLFINCFPNKMVEKPEDRVDGR
jgi:hypothetical protein